MASSSSSGDDHRRRRGDDDVIEKRQRYVELASEAAKAKRYPDQVDCMREVARLHVPLTHEERCLLRNGYRHMVEPRRFAWKYLSKMNQSEEITTELKRLEEKNSETCEQFFNVADEHLIPHDTHGESIVDYNTLKGDFYRYLAEVKTGFERNDAVDKSQKAYEAAIRVADAELSAADQFRLCAYMNLYILCSQFQGPSVWQPKRILMRCLVNRVTRAYNC